MYNILKFFYPFLPPLCILGGFLTPLPPQYGRLMCPILTLILQNPLWISECFVGCELEVQRKCRKGGGKKSCRFDEVTLHFVSFQSVKRTAKGRNTQGGLHTWRPHNFWICWPPPPLCPRNIYWLSTHLRHFRAYPTVRSSYMEAPNITNRRKLLHEGEWQKHRTLFSNSKSSSRERRAFWHEAFFVAPILTADWRSGRLSQSVSQSVPVQ